MIKLFLEIKKVLSDYYIGVTGYMNLEGLY